MSTVRQSQSPLRFLFAPQCNPRYIICHHIYRYDDFNERPTGNCPPCGFSDTGIPDSCPRRSDCPNGCIALLGNPPSHRTLLGTEQEQQCCTMTWSQSALVRNWNGNTPSGPYLATLVAHATA